MKKPLSFKELFKPPTNSALVPIVQVDPEEEKRKKTNQFLNQFKCPLCKCLLDGVATTDIINLKCAWVPDHFKIQIDNMGTEPRVLFDVLSFNDKFKRYTISRTFLGETITNAISIAKIDGDGNTDVLDLFESINNSTVLSGNLFDYQRLDAESLKNLIKTVLIFG